MPYMSDKEANADEATTASHENTKIPRGTKKSIRQAGTVAGQGLFGLLVFAVILTVTGALGFLVLRGAIESGPFLLAVGILLGFFLGTLNAVS